MSTNEIKLRCRPPRGKATDYIYLTVTAKLIQGDFAVHRPLKNDGSIIKHGWVVSYIPLGYTIADTKTFKEGKKLALALQTILPSYSSMKKKGELKEIDLTKVSPLKHHFPDHFRHKLLAVLKCSRGAKS